MNDYADRRQACADCSAEFLVSAATQALCAESQFAEPTRCPTCRASRAARAVVEEDKTLSCTTCGEAFVWDVERQR